MAFLTPAQREQLEMAAENADRLPDWPASSWAVLKESGALGWSIPQKFGGSELGQVELLSGLEELAACCLTTTFVLSQREAAIRHLLRGPPHLQERFLPGLAIGDQFATVGLSQLSTSRQHQGPALRATFLATGRLQLDGEIPWVTGADQAAAMVVGATLADFTQLLVVIPNQPLTGLIDPPLPLAALVGSRTSLVHCREVTVDPDCLLAGPSESVLGKVGGGGLETSCLAIGLASSAIGFMEREAGARPDLLPVTERFGMALHEHRQRLHELAVTSASAEQTLALRLDCTKLALRATQACLMVAKGVGFVAPHAAQRWARQALFFLVWSCPRPVAMGVIADLAAG
jgi:butyryl-CoA dehydrogenase